MAFVSLQSGLPPRMPEWLGIQQRRLLARRARIQRPLCRAIENFLDEPSSAGKLTKRALCVRSLCMRVHFRSSSKFPVPRGGLVAPATKKMSWQRRWQAPQGRDEKHYFVASSQASCSENGPFQAQDLARQLVMQVLPSMTLVLLGPSMRPGSCVINCAQEPGQNLCCLG